MVGTAGSYPLAQEPRLMPIFTIPVTYEYRADGWYYSEDLCRTWHKGVL